MNCCGAQTDERTTNKTGENTIARYIYMQIYILYSIISEKKSKNKKKKEEKKTNSQNLLKYSVYMYETDVLYICREREIHTPYSTAQSMCI